MRITRPVYLGVYEVTQAQYQAVMGNNPSQFSVNGGGKESVAGQSTERRPVEQVSWLDAVKFCNKLGEMEGRAPFYEIDGDNVRAPDWKRAGYRLPTEAEWEYACRANAPTVTRYSFGNDAASLGEFAWYGDNSGRKTHPVGEKRPNGFGLFDMHGNVWEWCWDGCGADYYKQSREDDPRGLDGASDRVVRGGSHIDGPRHHRSAHHAGLPPGRRQGNLGFRLALAPDSRIPTPSVGNSADSNREPSARSTSAASAADSPPKPAVADNASSPRAAPGEPVSSEISYADKVIRVQQALAASDAQQASEILASCPADLRGWEWHYLRQLCEVNAKGRASGSSQKGVGWAFAYGMVRAIKLGWITNASFSPYLLDICLTGYTRSTLV